MGFLSVLIAAIAAYAFGAVWYMKLASQWVAASGIAVDENGDPLNKDDKTPFIISFVCVVLVAGMMRHVFALSGIDGIGAGFVAGLGIGLFLATPWIVTNYSFSGRPRALMVIDGGYATIGCTVMGIVLGLF